MNVVLLVLGLIGFLGLVVVHEWGHFIAAKRNGVEVLEFGIGFPPRIFKRRTKGGWLFTINLLPLGGFVKLKGEHDTDNEPGSLGAASVWAKSQIMAAGVVMNVLSAYLILLMLAVIGLPQLVDNQFVLPNDVTYVSHAKHDIAAGSVEAGSPGAQAGITEGSQIVAFGLPGKLTPITSEDTLPALTKQYAGQTVEIQFYRGLAAQPTTAQVTLRSASEVAAAKAAGKQEGYLGVSVYGAQNGLTITRSTWSAPLVAGGVMWQYTALTFQGLGKAVHGLGGIVAGAVTGNTAARQAAQAEASSQVSGPVGIFFVFKYASAMGVNVILLILAILSLTLAIMNILPIPALDGGRLWLMLISRAVKRPLTPQLEEGINAAGFVFLVGLIILISIVDVRRFF